MVFYVLSLKFIALCLKLLCLVFFLTKQPKTLYLSANHDAYMSILMSSYSFYEKCHFYKILRR
ncbi:hypothetical protein HanIR_Chr09g0409001 [Helianthus annuus]|nr:hypothetical protein HanIR_Chr09g0409001 [Helianthus annuus]